MTMPESPFALDRPDAYARWRDEKLKGYPDRIEALLVEVRDPRQLSAPERHAILDRCRRANMAIYVSSLGDREDKEIILALGAQFGLHTLDQNRGADEDAITSLQVQSDAFHAEFIPYSDRPIAWHTDGYYNEEAHWIRGLLLHCVRPAHRGGENALLDHEILYLLLRDRNPEYIRALMHPQAMTIPAYREGGQIRRPARSGPVFWVDAGGHLHMRYTDRKRNVQWRDDPRTQEALAVLRRFLYEENTYGFQGRLESGWGLISNNVLHTRTGFEDGPRPRLLYRARYRERVSPLDSPD